MTLGYLHAAALAVAEELAQRLLPACHRVEIAGSLRRRREHVGDIELVYSSRLRLQTDPQALFGTIEEALAELKIQEWLRQALVTRRMNVAGLPIWGPQNKLGQHVASGIPVDLFATTEVCFWNYLVCRTGPADLNRRIAMAARARQLLWHPYGKGFTAADGSWRVMHSEQEVFETVGLPYQEPWER